MPQVIRAPSQIFFGAGVVQNVGPLAAQIARRVMIVTDVAIAQTESFSAVRRSLQNSGLDVDVFDGGSPELPMGDVDAATAAALKSSPDVLIGLGGGSSIDLAKLTGLMLSHPTPISRYYGECQVPGPITPVFAIPTTAGSGSEVTPVAVVGDPDRALKVGVSSPFLIPRVAICDPELTRTCPASVTAHSGMDALAHAIEAYTSKRLVLRPGDLLSQVFVGKNETSDRLALVAIRDVYASLRQAVTDPSDDARRRMMHGSLHAGLAFAISGTAAAHALQYAVGAATNTPHGLGTGLLLPFVMEFNRPVVAAELRDVARAMGLSSSDGDVGAPARTAIDAVRVLAIDVGIPASLERIGVARSQLEGLANQAAGVERLLRLNPRVAGATELLEILESAWTGSVRSGDSQGILEGRDDV